MDSRNEREGEINHNVALMRIWSGYPIRQIERTNISPRFNGIQPGATFRTSVTVGSQYARMDE